MQIYYINYDAPTPQTLRMGYTIKFKHIKWDKLENEKLIVVPYSDTDIIRRLGAPLNLFTWENDITYPDFGKSKAYFIVDQQNREIRLAITIYPQPSEDNNLKQHPCIQFSIKLNASEFSRFMWHLLYLVS